MIKAVVLASGFSSRMGENKLLLPFKGKPLIYWILNSIKETNFKEVDVIYVDEKVKDIAKSFGFNAIYNLNASLGQSESIKIAVKNYEGKGIMFFTGDQPLLKSTTIKFMLEEFEISNKIVIPLYKGQRGMPTIFPNMFFDELRSLKGDTGGRQIIKGHLEKVVFIEIDDIWEGFDVDSPQEYLYLKTKENEI
jgi:molybdenum cofactor cytidylyltransferase